MRETARAEQIAEGATVNATKHLLLVDDDDRMLFVLHRALTRSEDGYQVAMARTASEALAKIRAGGVDLLITDLVMAADMDGVELTKAVRALEPQVIVVWMTAFGCHKVARTAAELSVYTCLNKPVRIGKIRQVIRQALDTPGRKK
jgi:two-component system response regulator HydG